MFRSLNQILNIQQDKSDVGKILNDPDLDKEKFILGFKLIYSYSNAELGFEILKRIKPIDTCEFVEYNFIETLLNPFYRPNSASKTLKILQFILENASQPEKFEMAIHQHMAQYAKSGNIETNNLQGIMELINLITSKLNTPAFNDEFLHSMCVVIMKKLADVPVNRETNIKTMNMDCARIIEFFQMLYTNPSITISIITTVYDIITKEGDVSALSCLGLTVVPDAHIGNAVQHILTLSTYLPNQKKSIKNSIGRLILWQRTTSFNVPLHLWIVKIMRALYDQKHFEILNEVIEEHLSQSFLTLIIPAYQSKTFKVVQVMLEVQRSEELFLKIAPRINKLLLQIKKNNSEILEPLMDLLAEYMSSFPNARVICPESIQFLEAHGRSVERSISKYRNQLSYNSLGSNVRIGLENLGNTCYINSVIQALFMIKPFCYELLQLERPDRETMTVQRIFALLLFSNRSELNLKFAMQFIRPVDFLPGIQHDSTEFMASLLDKLHEADKKFKKRENGIEASGEENGNMEVTTESLPSMIDENEKIEEDEPEGLSTETITDHTTELNESTIIHKNFGGKMSTTCVCMSCEYRSISIDSFRDLSLSFPERPKNDDDWDVETEYSVQELLDFFFKPEDLKIDNQYHCDRCKTLCDGVRCNAVLESPKNLILTLKHFRYDSRYHTRSKLLINKMFHNEVISLNVNQGCERRTVEYRLQAAVVHSGISVDSGHYYTFARENEQTWYKFNDSYVSDSTLKELNNLNSPNTPYILFYRRISSASSTASSSTACSSDSPITGEEKLNFETLPQFLRTCIVEDNAAYEKESKKFIFQQNKVLTKSDRWNDDDPPPSSCGSNLGVQHNRFIY